MPRDKSDVNRLLCPGLDPGTVLQVQVEGVGATLSYLIGRDQGLHLIIKTPYMADIAKKLYEKNHVVLRYVYAGQVFGFRSTIMALIKEPFRFCILSYPESVETINLRKHMRISCLIPAEIRFPQGLYGAFIANISLGGCYLELNMPKDGAFPLLKIGDEASLTFKMSESGRNNQIDIAVRMVKLDNRMMIIGAQFIHSSSPETDALAMDAVKAYLEAF